MNYIYTVENIKNVDIQIPTETFSPNMLVDLLIKLFNIFHFY